MHAQVHSPYTGPHDLIPYNVEHHIWWVKGNVPTSHLPFTANTTIHTCHIPYSWSSSVNGVVKGIPAVSWAKCSNVQDLIHTATYLPRWPNIVARRYAAVHAWLSGRHVRATYFWFLAQTR